MASNALRQIKMRHILAFVETVQRGSLKAAADHSHLTQPAISKTLKDLERILGTRLLHRDRGGLDLTPEGAVFLQFAEQSLIALGQGITSLEALGTGTAAPLRIGTLPSVAADLLPDVILRFNALAPATPITVEDGPISALIDQLRSGDLDLVVGRMGRPEAMTGLSFTQLYAEQVVFVAAPNHPLAGCDDPAAIAGALVLSPPKGAAIRPLVDRFLIGNGISEFPNKLETVSGAFGRAMTLGPAQAIWIISQGVVAADLAAGRMVRLPIDTTAMAGPVGIMARSEDDPTPTMRLFRQALLASVEPSAAAPKRVI